MPTSETSTVLTQASRNKWLLRNGVTMPSDCTYTPGLSFWYMIVIAIFFKMIGNLVACLAIRSKKTLESDMVDPVTW
jgi:hypothetical protein